MKYVDMAMRPLSDAAEFHLTLHTMGFDHAEAVRLIDVPGPPRDAQRIMRRWREGIRPIPKPVWDKVMAMHAVFTTQVAALIAQRRAAGAEATPLVTYPTAVAFHEAVPEARGQLPIAYHWALMLRVREATGATVVYADKVGE